MLKARHIVVTSMLLIVSMGFVWLGDAKTLSTIVHPSTSLKPLPEFNLTLQDMDRLLVMVDRRIEVNEQDYEAWLIKGMVLFYKGENEQSVAVLQELTVRAPNFHLAHLIYGDVLLAHSRPVKNMLDAGMSKIDSLEEQVAALRDEANARLYAHVSRLNSHDIPLQLLNMGHTTNTAIVVDKSKNRLYVFQRVSANEPPQLIVDYYVSTGKKPGSKIIEGDLKTPEGVYFITGFIPDEKLPEKYGLGAYPTNYPNTLDRRFGRTGNGIWLHGTDPVYYSRPPLDSEGCVVLSNVDLTAVQSYIEPGVTPVIITEEVQWVDHQTWYVTRSTALKSIEKWRRDWESLDVDKYLSHYDPEFWNNRHNHSSWTSYKKRVAKQKKFQKVNLSAISVYYYPKAAANGEELILATFRQEYTSNNYKGDVNKKILLGKRGNQWKIVYEGK